MVYNNAMEEQSPQILEYAELLLDEEKKQEARLLLVAYIKRNPTSADAWWVMSRAVEDEKQELDCLERALRLDPAHEQSRLRMEALKNPSTPLPTIISESPSQPKPASASQQPPVPEPQKTPAPASQQPPALEPQKTPPPGAQQPAASSVSPFVFSEEESKSDQGGFDLFAPGAFDNISSTPSPAPGPDESKPDASKPDASKLAESKPDESKSDEVPSWAVPPTPSQEPPPGGKEAAPRKKRTWVVDVVIIGIVLCVLLAVVIYFLLSDMGQTMINDIQGTQEVALVMTARPPNTLEPTWTASPTFTPLPPTLTPVPPTETPTSLYTPTISPIPVSAIGITVGRYPPDFTLLDVATNAEVSLRDYEGYPVLIFFWATWCPYCNDEIPNLQHIFDDYQADGLVVLAVEGGDAFADVDSFRLSHGMTFPVLLDLDKAVLTRYKAASIPHHVFVGMSGKIMFVVTGELSYSELDAKVQAAMRVFPTATP
jgi:cytochrome c biogenesis protein CcmG/thiol:disulfide interchange protein DsbE